MNILPHCSCYCELSWILQIIWKCSVYFLIYSVFIVFSIRILYFLLSLSKFILSLLLRTLYTLHQNAEEVMHLGHCLTFKVI